MKSEYIPAIILICGLLICFPFLRYFYKKGRKEAKGKFAPNLRMRKIKEIVTFKDWYDAHYDEIYDTWLICGKGFELDTFALGLFTGSKEVMQRLKLI
jgi:hypothetical protein